MVQAHIYYFGMVQGVGFRYTAHRFAKQLDLTGWIRNLSDGRVETVVEGSKETIQDFLSHLDEHFHQYVKKSDINYTEITRGSLDFEIRGTY
ncbi:MAG: acylphosphatase [Candidatus Aceula meridiana]|nr:acylphosphatase [Candidatus Aceula meridiana]